MSLFLAMLPVYLIGNLHCMGMCGPLVAMIGQHRYRWHYFLGRLVSFALAGGVAGGLGAAIGALLAIYHLSALTSLLFGFWILLIAFSGWIGFHLPGAMALGRRLSSMGRWITPLMLYDRRWPTFLFGLLTIALPCGQTLIVYSACALAGDMTVGLANGALFALFTSPSLWVAMHAHRLFPKSRDHSRHLLGIAGSCVGALAIGRGLADLGLIPHLVLSTSYHIVIY